MQTFHPQLQKFSDCGGLCPKDPLQMVQDLYRSIYFQFLDHIMSNISNRFDQPSFQLYTAAEGIIVDAANGRPLNANNFSLVTGRYEGDFDSRRFNTQLGMLHEVFRNKAEVKTLSDVVGGLKQLGEAKYIYSEVNTVLQLLLTVPASSATAERSFSTLRRLKNYLRTTMTAARLNNLTLLHVYQERVDSINIDKVADDFIAGVDLRLKHFGSGKCKSM